MIRNASGLAVLALLGLAACGADGPPDTPAPPPQTSTNVGVSISTSGYARVGVAVSRGPVSFGVAF
ncbi:MAG: hypothetical protein ACWA5A_18490 [Marinibacterium sp.]